MVEARENHLNAFLMQNKGFSNFLLVNKQYFYLYLIDFNMSYTQLSLLIIILDEIIASSTNGLFRHVYTPSYRIRKNVGAISEHDAW